MKIEQKHGSNIPRLAVSLGDPNGIGTELVLKVLQEKSLFSQFKVVLYGSLQVIEQTLQREALHLSYEVITDERSIHSDNIYVINVTPKNFVPTPSRPSKAGAREGLQAFVQACRACKNQYTHALVTAPLSKQSFDDKYVLSTLEPFELSAQTFKDIQGHTEFLQHFFQVQRTLMLLISNELRIALLTTHIPLKRVSKLLTPMLLQCVYELLRQTLAQDFGISSAKIACLGLNPHAGEEGRLGQEEQTLFTPFIQTQQQKGHLLKGPFAADGFFGSRQYTQFDAILAPYHDQGLIPFKLLAFKDGVNFTAGLPIVRTSPAHGTAYELVGKKQASPSSMRAAFLSAAHLHTQRTQSL